MINRGVAGRRPRLRRDHPCATAFLDETGSIAQDRFFAVGVVKVAEPAVLLRAIQKFRDRRQWYGEVHFTDLKPRSVRLYREFVDVVLAADGVNFWCFVADREQADPVERFGTPWDAYAKLAEQLLVGAIRQDELLTVLADNYSSPDDVLFEQEVRAGVNRRLGRLAVVSVCRLDSRSSDGLQVADLLTSAAAHEFRAAAGLAGSTGPKADLAAYVRANLGAATCLPGWRSTDHSVQVYNHGKYRLSLDASEERT